MAHAMDAFRSSRCQIGPCRERRAARAQWQVGRAEQQLHGPAAPPWHPVMTGRYSWEFCKMNPALTLQFERAVNEYARWQAVPAEDRSDAPVWWWDTALAAVDETATMPVEWCGTLGVADGSTYAEGAEVFRNTLLRQTHMPYSENFPCKFKAIGAAAIVSKSS